MKKQKHADKVIFWVCLVITVGLFIGSFFCPPKGEIHPSCLKAGGILFAMQALGIVGQNLANGKDVIFHKDDVDIKIGDDEKE